jgi:hypothetical protein
VPPIYQPEVAARAVLMAADNPKRREYWAGASTVATISADKVVPALLDRYLARTGYKSQQTSQEPPLHGSGNLWQPLDRPDGHDYGAHGVFDEQAHPHSTQLWLSRHSRAVTGAAAGALATATALLARRRKH